MTARDAATAHGDLESALRALKEIDGADVSVPDIRRFADVMTHAMHNFFGALDTALYKEFQEIGQYIAQMRAEIGRLEADDLKAQRIPMAGEELDAVVRATEEATETIMECAETIMAADTSDPAAYQANVAQHVTRIFEACAFQDITGQRISKVVQTLRHIEDRGARFSEAIGPVETAARPNEEQARREQRDKALLLNGPQSKGAAIEQHAVDALLSADGDTQADIDAMFE